MVLKRTQLVVHWVDGRTESFPLLKDRIRIGRGTQDNDISIPLSFQSVSRKHLEVRKEKESFRLVDLGSSNGTLVNGVHATDIVLKDGDEIKIGQDEQQIRIEFRLGNESLLDEITSEEKIATLPPTPELANEASTDTPHFKIRWHNGRTNFYLIEKDRIIVGRGGDADLRVPETLRFVSSTHFDVQKKRRGISSAICKARTEHSSITSRLKRTMNIQLATNRSFALATITLAFPSVLLFAIQLRLLML
jgi:pSer/pThr/pTyr-binding forkhead associated (FHA) protein